MSNYQSLVEVEAEVRRLVCQYARAMDSNLPGLLETIFTEDVVIKAPGFTATGLTEACAIPAMLTEMYEATQHRVLNQTVTVQGDNAEAETYSTASHLLPQQTQVSGEDQRQIMVWAIRYRDKFRYQEQQWLISERALIVDWTENRTVEMLAG